MKFNELTDEYESINNRRDIEWVMSEIGKSSEFTEWQVLFVKFNGSRVKEVYASKSYTPNPNERLIKLFPERTYKSVVEAMIRKEVRRMFLNKKTTNLDL
jgi:hypothetical protein